MAEELFCIHRWSLWFEAQGEKPGDEAKRWRVCNSLCKRYHVEGEPEPDIAIGKIK